MPTLISRAIITDYYDGAIQGIASLNDLGPHRFDVVAWDLDSNLRVYAFAPFPNPSDIWGRIEDAMHPKEAPEWPLWYPRLQTPEGLEDETVGKPLKSLLDEATGYAHACLSKDLADSCGSLVRLTNEWQQRANDFRKTGEVQALADWLTLFP